MPLGRFSPPIKGIKAAVESFLGKKDEPVYKENGKALYKEDIIADVLGKLEKRKRERFSLEQQWLLNSNFYIGNQYCDINIARGRIEPLIPVYSWLEREAFNRINSLVETRKANLKKIDLSMKVNPRTNEMEDYHKADVSTDILKYYQNITDFSERVNTILSWSELTGNAFILSWWDSQKGEEILRTITEDEVKSYYEGDLDYGILTPFDVYPENLFKQGIENQRSIIIEQIKTVEEIKDVYGIDVDGKQIQTFALDNVSKMTFGTSRTFQSIGMKTVDDSEKIITYFEKPTRSNPDGKLIIIVANELIYYGNLPYRQVPVVQCICNEMPGQFFGRSVIEDLIPLQRAYNGTLNRIHDFIKGVALRGHYVEEGSIDIDWYKEEGSAPGACVVYKRGSNAPIPIPNGNLPNELMNERQQLINDMEYVAGTSQLMTKGALPSGVTSGTAIQNLINIDNTRLSITADNLRNAVKKMSRTWLEILHDYAKTPRIVRFVGANKIGVALTWSQDDINSYDIIYDTENDLMLREEIKQERFMQAWQMGLFTDENGVVSQRYKNQMLNYLKLGNYSDMLSINDLQLQAAQRENSYFVNGVMPQIGEFDDDTIHIEEHLRFVLQMKYKLVKYKNPESANMFEMHIKEHEKRQKIKSEQNLLMKGM